ncbi:DEAD/DEAH box helicase [Actinomadura sp. DC4]|uniref:DEAD/DEAH box helicase n=1 Tax=Actinomadura sp. DC4 TaxID=3055069 RepID=UPI0025B0FFD8|nr:DEAD/DEAH box helicase [Actinomadura sp. DC4]MDN3351453.1 DEAD/DEAH box helicase [Actinomadura sp. DC4]
MTTSQVSGSEPASAAFGRLHPDVRRWIWQRGWRELHPAQEAAVEPVLAGEDVLISAATASGKTEAAFLPICSGLAATPADGPGIQAVYIGPLKALINDQQGRLDSLCELLGIPVHPWHGDVAAAAKQRVLKRPGGILLITPESLEALFVVRATKIFGLFGALRHVVVDELHSFIGTERGAQLQSLLHRLELAVRRRVPRIGLSATLGDLADAAEFLRPGGGARVRLIAPPGDAQELRLQLRGHVHSARSDADAEITAHLFAHLRGTDNLVFANSRSRVEQFTDRLTRRAERTRVPNEFVPHHGNLSKDLREHVEARLRDRSLPVTAICTSTLEMGIDIGSVTSVAQIGAPSSVAALRQRLGRSGRRGDPAVLRIYVREEEVTASTAPQDQVRAELVQTIAVVDLLLERWYEPPSAGGLHLSTLTQQILSLIAQHGGVTPAEAYRTLCGDGPFHHVGQGTFGALLRALGSAGLLRQEPDGLLLHDETGERIVNHYGFFAAFASPEEYRLVAEGRTLGSLAPAAPVLPGGLLIFAGRRWRIQRVDGAAKVIDLTPSSGGAPPAFGGGAADVHDRIRARMRLLYERTDVPAYLDTGARRLLAEARDNFRRLGLDAGPVVGWGDDTYVFPFRGDAVMAALGLALALRGVRYEKESLALRLPQTSPERAVELLDELAAAPPPDPRKLAAPVLDKELDKYDEYLGEDLLTTAYAARRIDVPAAWEALPGLVAAARRRTPTRVPRVAGGTASTDSRTP